MFVYIQASTSLLIVVQLNYWLKKPLQKLSIPRCLELTITITSPLGAHFMLCNMLCTLFAFSIIIPTETLSGNIIVFTMEKAES